jgi:hypothetical protein
MHPYHLSAPAFVSRFSFLEKKRITVFRGQERFGRGWGAFACRNPSGGNNYSTGWGEWKDVRKAAAPTLFALFVVGRADSIP